MRTSAMDRLARDLAAGNAVFFIGAGFSLDSEGNTGVRLVRRVVVRMLALFRALEDQLSTSHPEACAKVNALRRQFLKLHRPDSLKKRDLDDLYFHPDFVKEIGKKYYEFNDWCVSALTQLAVILCDTRKIAPDARRRLSKEIQIREQIYFSLVGGLGLHAETLPPDPHPRLPRINIARLAQAYDPHLHQPRPDPRGKMLFLDAVGMRSPRVMAGFSPQDSRARMLHRRLAAKVYPRHIALARFAREGVAPQILTSNFDLLLEAAFHLVGFVPWQEQGKTNEAPIPMRQPYYGVIGQASDYLQQHILPDGAPVCRLIKIHGCAGKYRGVATDKIIPFDLDSVLRAIVFTYREVQNWRDDAWSRDLLYTLVRTRTLAFAGYSTADPVLHDSFRNAYEEMARYHPPPPSPFSSLGSPPADGGRAFYFAPHDTPEFYLQEILRAGGRAADGNVRCMVDSTNRLDFHFKRTSFPDMDDRFVELSHRLYRQIQQRAVAAELESAVRSRLGHRVPAAELAQVQDLFDRRIKKEMTILDKINTTTDRKSSYWPRRIFHSITAWTWYFHPTLLRDLAIDQYLATHAASPTASGMGHDALRDGDWYYAANDNFGLTAWSVVVELALRQIGKQVKQRVAGGPGGGPGAAHRPGARVERGPGYALGPVAGRQGLPVWPVVRFCQASGLDTHVWLDLQHGRMRRPPAWTPSGLPVRRRIWFLTSAGQPQSTASRLDRRTVAAPALWQAALGQVSPDFKSDLI